MTERLITMAKILYNCLIPQSYILPWNLRKSDKSSSSALPFILKLQANMSCVNRGYTNNANKIYEITVYSNATIGNLLTEEAIYRCGVEEQVDRLQTELKWMQRYLMDAETKQSKDERIRLWVAEIRELAYDAEDVVEEFALKIVSKNKGGLPSCIKRSACGLKEGWALHKTRSKIEKIIERINDVVRRLQAYGVKELKDRGEESSSSTERRESRRPYPHIMDDNTVGLIYIGVQFWLF
ncbi:hypothetical protein Gotur_028939 [Gossypium turneri]